jgi:hypothetical protein
MTIKRGDAKPNSFHVTAEPRYADTAIHDRCSLKAAAGGHRPATRRHPQRPTFATVSTIVLGHDNRATPTHYRRSPESARRPSPEEDCRYVAGLGFDGPRNPSNLRATSFRCRAQMVSGRAAVATLPRALRRVGIRSAISRPRPPDLRTPFGSQRRGKAEPFSTRPSQVRVITGGRG